MANENKKKRAAKAASEQRRLWAASTWIVLLVTMTYLLSVLWLFLMVGVTGV